MIEDLTDGLKSDNNGKICNIKSLIPVNTHLTALNEHVSVCDK